MTASFADRAEAGRLLGAALSYPRGRRPMVLAIPRGGVPVAAEVATIVGGQLDVAVTRKIGAPGEPEYAIGAVNQDGEIVTDTEAVKTLGVSDEYLRQESRRKLAEVLERLQRYRRGRPFPSLSGRSVVLVDDGIATGLTTRAALMAIRRRGPKTVIIATPVAPMETLEALKTLADKVVCLLTPYPFFAVGQFYANFEQVDDSVVERILRSSWDREADPSVS